MDAIPADLKYTETHEWVREEHNLKDPKKDQKAVIVGITDHAQDLLGELVFVKLPRIGDSVHAGDDIAVVESVKAASDVYAPISGKVVAINDQLEEAPSLVNQDPYGDGWLFKIEVKDPDEFGSLMDSGHYEEHIGEESE